MPRFGRKAERLVLPYGLFVPILLNIMPCPNTFIQDVKSSNCERRLSAEGLESQPLKLKTDDIVVSSYLTIS